MIVGSCIAGCSTAQHLSRLGQTDAAAALLGLWRFERRDGVA